LVNDCRRSLCRLENVNKKLFCLLPYTNNNPAFFFVDNSPSLSDLKRHGRSTSSRTAKDKKSSKKNTKKEKKSNSKRGRSTSDAAHKLDAALDQVAIDKRDDSVAVAATIVGGDDDDSDSSESGVCCLL
jgi:hypothetical protein